MPCYFTSMLRTVTGTSSASFLSLLHEDPFVRSLSSFPQLSNNTLLPGIKTGTNNNGFSNKI